MEISAIHYMLIVCFNEKTKKERKKERKENKEEVKKERN